MVGHGNMFAVRVAGDSMVDANIFDGDCLVVRQQDDAVNGDIVAALLGDEGVVEMFRRTENDVWLMPENPGYDPILGDDCRIMGKVVATLHSHRNGSLALTYRAGGRPRISGSGGSSGSSYEIVHPITTEPWGVRRFFVRAPDGDVINIVNHRDYIVGAAGGGADATGRIEPLSGQTS